MSGKKGSTRQRLRCWVFTIQTEIFESNEGDITKEGASYESQWDPWAQDFDKQTIRYIVCGAEICPESRRYHWQGYFEANKAVDLSTAKKLLFCNFAHLEPRRGTSQQAIDYCKKGDSGVLDSSGDKLLFEMGSPAAVSRRDKNKNYTEVLSKETYQEALSTLQELEPADYVKFHSNVKRALREHYSKTTVYIRSPEEFKRPLISSDVYTKLSVVLTGISGAGKTAYAKAHFKCPLVVSHVDDLKKLDPLIYDGVVFDDMSFAHWPVSSCIHLLDMEEERSINCRHTCGVLPAWFPRFFTSNKALHDVFAIKECNEQEEVAIFRRMHHVMITEKLF